MFKKSSIKSKIYRSFGIVLFFMAVTGFYVFIVVNMFQDISKLKTLRYEQINAVKELKQINIMLKLVAMNCILDKDTGTMNKKSVEDINNYFKNIRKKENELVRESEPVDEKKSIDKIIFLFKKLEPLIKKELKSLIETGASKVRFEDLKKKITQISSELDQNIDRVHGFTDEKLKQAYEDEAGLALFLKVSIIVGIAFVFAVGLIFAAILSKNITNGLKSLNEAIVNLCVSKDTSSRIIIKSKDELGDIANDFNKYLQSIEDNIKDDNIFIKDTQRVMEMVAKGQLLQQIEANTHNHALIHLKNTINEALKNLQKVFESINNTLESYTSYDYTKELNVDHLEKEGAFDKLVKDINKLRDSITGMLVENKTNGLMLLDSSNTLFSNIQTLSNSANEAAASLEETSAAVKEITSNISNNTSNIIQMASYANELAKSSKEGQKLANQTTLSMDEINSEVTAINEAIRVIDQISFQTNILSLNAAVEAATAGDAGKGFAVVAGEVRNLASRSAEAANEIKALVETATQKANSGKNISDKMIGGYTKLNESISKMSELITDIETASKEQQQGITQVNDAINSLDGQTRQNANIASQTYDVAMQTEKISKIVVASTEGKKFEGEERY